MADRIAVDPDVLVEHARRVERVGDDVRTAASTVRQAGLPPGALGQMCAFLVVPAEGTATTGQTTIDSASSMVEWTGQQVRVWAQYAQDAQDRVLDMIRSLRSEIA